MTARYGLPQVQVASTISKDCYAVTDFQFGAPSALRLDDEKIMIVYWCEKEGRVGIDWTTINLI